MQVKYEALLALHTQPHIKTTTASIAPAVKERIVIRDDAKAIKRRASHDHPSQSLGKNAGRALVQANSPKLKPKSKLARRNSLQFMANNTASQPMTSSAVTQLKNSGMGTDTSASFSTRQLKDRFDILNIKNNNGKTQAAKKQRTKVGIILFTGFELLDAFGPMEMFGLLTRLQVNQAKRRLSACMCCSPSLFIMFVDGICSQEVEMVTIGYDFTAQSVKLRSEQHEGSPTNDSEAGPSQHDNKVPYVHATTKA